MKPDSQPELEPFLRRIRSPALAFAVVRLRDEDTALDMVQETMIGFVKVASGYGEEAWTNLFYKILLRRITDWQRKVAWRTRLCCILPFSQLGNADDDDGEDNITAHAGNTIQDMAESAYDAGILFGHFERVLQSLPARQQEAYLLRQWQGMDVKATADIMGCSQGSVKTHLSRAMQTLREQLGEWLDE
ncbi:MAG: sigma-70 family RNA polymerase sigma factor [Gammaproteobacteria bacterium]|nr:sigma-70 family RNA polymerase sigma factor [Gammaproteobacteria bacterium]MBU1724276.1 sigma-70 family RNA polymerase sigma factor [Gammaproteobacteria bacterium]MBU2006296.1 sigma-70 family RNA polymerase sigma factor [Gammaproteobacteria bacterium]